MEPGFTEEEEIWLLEEMLRKPLDIILHRLPEAAKPVNPRQNTAHEPYDPNNPGFVRPDRQPAKPTAPGTMTAETPPKRVGQGLFKRKKPKVRIRPVSASLLELTRKPKSIARRLEDLFGASPPQGTPPSPRKLPDNRTGDNHTTVDPDPRPKSSPRSISTPTKPARKESAEPVIEADGPSAEPTTEPMVERVKPAAIAEQIVEPGTTMADPDGQPVVIPTKPVVLAIPVAEPEMPMEVDGTGVSATKNPVVEPAAETAAEPEKKRGSVDRQGPCQQHSPQRKGLKIRESAEFSNKIRLVVPQKPLERSNRTPVCAPPAATKREPKVRWLLPEYPPLEDYPEAVEDKPGDLFLSPQKTKTPMQKLKESLISLENMEIDHSCQERKPSEPSPPTTNTGASGRSRRRGIS
ncbi:uncharacterized protein LOC141529351 [Cotesia typhae]|uniref:uncharacterized protein LOC141529351 n=1 Tax=Cotesia typhae TaxID=2053667 RepID=UPI003D68D153